MANKRSALDLAFGVGGGLALFANSATTPRNQPQAAGCGPSTQQASVTSSPSPFPAVAAPIIDDSNVALVALAVESGFFLACLVSLFTSPAMPRARPRRRRARVRSHWSRNVRGAVTLKRDKE
jgi:hypothetical protein